MKYTAPTHDRFSRMPAQRRVVITGLGAVSAAGIGVSSFWQALLEKRSGIGPITRFDTTGIESRISGEVKNFNAVELIPARLKPKRMSRQAQFAVVAAAEAAKDAGFMPGAFAAKRIGIIIGSCIASVESIVESTLRMHEKGPAFGDPGGVLACNLQGSALAMADFFGIHQAMAMTVSTACASGIDAVRLGSDMIRSGRFNIVICGGTDAPISMTPWAEFTLLGMNSHRNDDPGNAVRPFDRDSDTGLISEGAGVVILEDRESALSRQARPYLEILGAHASIDPESNPIGSGLELTMRGSLQNAVCQPEEIDFISAWGCGQPKMDRTETRLIKKVFGNHAYDLAVASIKAVVGNPLSAAGPLQIIAVALSHRHGIIPPTTNQDYADVDFDLDYVSRKPRRTRLRKSLVNAHGMGGNNVSLVLGEPN